MPKATTSSEDTKDLKYEEQSRIFYEQAKFPIQPKEILPENQGISKNI